MPPPPLPAAAGMMPRRPPRSATRALLLRGLRWAPVVLSLLILWLCFPSFSLDGGSGKTAKGATSRASIARKPGEAAQRDQGGGVLDSIRGVGAQVPQSFATDAPLPPRKPHVVRPANANSEAVYDLLRRVLGDQYGEGLLRRIRIVIDPTVTSQDWCAKNQLRRAPGDCVSIESRQSLLIFNASTGVGAAWAVHHVLKTMFRTSVSWGAERHGLNMDETLLQHLLDDAFTWGGHAQRVGLPHEYTAGGPSFDFVMRLVAPAPRRYMYNVCTFGYTTAFYGWAEWEREIDWLALHGINLPLALIGQEAIWMRLWKSRYNLSDADIFEHFTGPAFWPWHWMGNLRGWAGPITPAYVEKRRLLQHQILDRMRSLGMSPVLQAFGGHVPEAVATVLTAQAERSNGKWGAPRQSVNWMGFRGKYTGVYMLDPVDPAFHEIGSAFVREMRSEYGAAEYYNADTFNEMVPPTMDPDYLFSSGAAVLKGIQGGDPQGKWLVQGWLFLHHRHLWNRAAVKAYLDGAGLGNVMVLDLASDIMPMWPRHDAYFGHDYVWCMLHSFGGRRGIFGNHPDLMEKLQHAYLHGGPGLVGVGMSMEATHHNPAMYEALADLFFVDSISANPHVMAISSPSVVEATSPAVVPWPFIPPKDRATITLRTAPLAWAKLYIDSRYGQVSPDDTSYSHLVASFNSLLGPNGAYAHRVTCCPTWTLMAVTPTLDLQSTSLDIDYDPDDFATAARHMVQAVIKSKENIGPGLRYDAVDFLRQGIENLFTEFAITLLEVTRNYRATAGFKSSGERSKRWIDLTRAIQSAVAPMFGDLDNLLSYEADLDSRSWFSAAVRGATDDGLDADKMLFNAKNLITAWGDSNGQGYPNYAAKSWSGLYRRLYAKRWDAFFDSLVAAMTAGKYALDQDYETAGSAAELDWRFCVNHTAEDRSATAPKNADKTTPALRAVIENLSLKWLGEPDLDGMIKAHQFGSQIRARTVSGAVPTHFVLCLGRPPQASLLYARKIEWGKSLASRVVMCDALGDVCGAVDAKGALYGQLDASVATVQCRGAVRKPNATQEFFLLREAHA